MIDEGALRLGIFLSMLLILALAEWRWPRRTQPAERSRRWLANAALIVVGTLLMRLLLPILALDMAVTAEVRGWGLFNILQLPALLAVVLGVLLLDVAIYFQHRLFHWSPWLWPLHRVHHSDGFLDVSSGIRFHPLEILLSMLIKLALVLALGLPWLAVLVFEIALNAGSLFTHSNLRLPLGLDRILRKVIVTPDMHRVHHSVHRDEQHSNYGFHLSLWDRLFGSYRDQPREGHLAMHLGVEGLDSRTSQHLGRLLIQPLTRTLHEDAR